MYELMYDLLFKYIQNKTEIDSKSFSACCHYFKPKEVKKNEIILMEGDICHHNIFVNKGCLKFYAVNDEGKELIRYFAFESKFGTALSSFIEQKPFCRTACGHSIREQHRTWVAGISSLTRRHTLFTYYSSILVEIERI